MTTVLIRTAAILGWLFALVPACTADPPAGPTTSSRPATTTAPAVSPQLDCILDQLEKQGDKIKDLTADLRHDLYQSIVEDRQIKLGQIMFKRIPGKRSARFMVRFDQLIQDDLRLKQKEWFCFDGQWLREIRQRTKTVIDRQVVQPGKTVDVFKIDGPFPLPFGQSKADILKSFDVKLIPPTKKDPPNTDHLLLIPKPGTKLAKEYARLQFWVDRTRHLSTRIVADDRHNAVTTVEFKNIKINTGIDDKTLWPAKPAGYSYTREPLAPQP